MQHSHPILALKPLILPPPTSYLLPLHPHHHPMLPVVFLTISCFLFPFDSIRVFPSKAGGLRARSTELLHFHTCHPVDLICIPQSNLHSSSSFRIPAFSTSQSDRTHSLSGILSLDATHASGGVIIFVRQGLSFS